MSISSWKVAGAVLGLLMLLAVPTTASATAATVGPAIDPTPVVEASPAAGDEGHALECWLPTLSLDSAHPGCGQVEASCSSDCTLAYLSCLDDCDAWPYPGCAQDCRNALNACRKGCF